MIDIWGLIAGAFGGLLSGGIGGWATAWYYLHGRLRRKVSAVVAAACYDEHALLSPSGDPTSKAFIIDSIVEPTTMLKSKNDGEFVLVADLIVRNDSDVTVTVIDADAFVKIPEGANGSNNVVVYRYTASDKYCKLPLSISPRGSAKLRLAFEFRADPEILERAGLSRINTANPEQNNENSYIDAIIALKVDDLVLKVPVTAVSANLGELHQKYSAFSDTEIDTIKKEFTEGKT